jgi:integrase
VDDDPGWAPLRGNAGAPAGARAGGQLGLLDVNPAKLGVENPQRRYREKRPFDSWDEVYALADRLGPRHGPVVLFAVATGLRPGEWLALEHRDVDRAARVVYVRRTFRNGRIKTPKTKASVRAVPMQAIALAALDELSPNPHCALLFPSVRGGYLDLHDFRTRAWKPAQRAAGIEPLRRVYDLRHTFATFALRARISTFDLSRYMGTSLAMIDRHYGHLARDGRARDQSAGRLQSSRILRRPRGGRRWTLNASFDAIADNGKGR